MGDESPFKSYEQDQGALFPAFLADALDPSDPAFFVQDAVEGLDLRAFEARYAVLGERAYAPRLMLKLWLYAATQGVYSGREIARRIRRDVGFRYLAGTGRHPDFRTINRFRVRHREDFAEVFRQTVRLARASGLGALGVVAIDGTKIRANTSKHKAMSHSRMREAEEKLEREIASILARQDQENAEEESEHGDDDDGGGGLPVELQDAQRRREKIRAAREQLEAEKGERLEARHQKSFADPQAQMMKLGDGALQYAYNAQAAVSEDGLIVATGLSTKVKDEQHLVPMTEAVRKTTGQRPGRVLADKGYLSEGGLWEMRRRRQPCLIAVGREGKKLPKWPRGRYTQRMHRMLRLPWARRSYARRKTQGERPFAEIKAVMGFRRFMLRGVHKVRGEWDLVCAAFNLRRLAVRAAATI